MFVHWFRALTIVLLLVVWLLPMPASAAGDCQRCSCKRAEKETFLEHLAPLTYYLLFPRGESSPPSWIAERAHRALLIWDRHQAKHGSPAAAYEVGRSIYFGMGTPPNETEGLRWLLKAANQGDLMARYTVAAIGLCRYSQNPFLPGQPFTKRNYATLPIEIRDQFTEKQCQTWLTEAAEAGYPKAIRLRAFVPEIKQESEWQSMKTVLLWLEKAQDAGDPYAQLCRRKLLGFKSVGSLRLPNFVWTPWGTP